MVQYAGVGARNTPPEIINYMQLTAIALAQDGCVCRTGAALGADQSFAEGAMKAAGQVDLSIPWHSYEKVWVNSLRQDLISVNVIQDNNVKAFESVQLYHPAPDKLKHAVKKLHARNYMIVEPADYVVCWTPEGATVGGTGQAIRIAEDLGKHVYNLGKPEVLQAFVNKLIERGLL